MIWLIIGIIVLMTFAVIADRKRNSRIDKKHGDSSKNLLTQINDFTSTKEIVGIRNRYIFAVDENRKKIAYIENNTTRIIDFDKIFGVEVLEDNEYIYQKSIKRAILGGVLAAKEGIFLGALFAPTKQNKLVSKVQIKIKIRDINFPSLYIDCFDCKIMTVEGKPASTSDLIYKEGINKARFIVDIINVIIDMQDKEMQSNVENITLHEDIIKEVKPTNKITTNNTKSAEVSKEIKLDMPNSKKSIINNTVPSEVKIALQKGNPIEAVKIYKNITGCSLDEAKKYIDSIR